VDSALSAVDHFVSHATLYYTFISLYVGPCALTLVVWMALIPVKFLRDLPAVVFNLISDKVIPKKAPRFVRLTTPPVVVLAVLLITEYLSMGSRQSELVLCQKGGFSSCDHLKGLKWRAERNFYMMLCDFLLLGMIDVFTKNQREERETVDYKSQVDTYLEVFAGTVDFKEATASFEGLPPALRAKGLKRYFESRVKIHHLFELLDGDGNGNLSKAELKVIHGSDGQLALFFDRLDSDDDQSLSAAEFASYFSDVEARKGEQCVNLMLSHWTQHAKKGRGAAKNISKGSSLKKAD